MKVWLSLVLFISFGVLLAGAVKLAVVRGSYYQALSRDNRVMETRIPAARGEIVDRKGRTVAKSVYQYFKKQGTDRVYEGSGDYQGDKFEGKDLAYDLKRQYPYGASLGLVTGYVGKASGKELDSNKCDMKIDQNDLMGRSGIEDAMDCDLRGEDGKRLIEVDAKGNYVRELGREEPVPGDQISLSLDAFWQNKVYKLLDGKKAVVIMSQPQTGKVLVMASSPSFDPNAFSFQQDNRAIAGYLSDSAGLPMLNRAMGAKYYPGSVFKPVLATAGLESGIITAETTFEDTGVLKVGDYSFNNWLWTKRGTTDGMVSIVKALQRSNDVYFYQLGGNLGLDRIDNWAKTLGYGSKTGIELPGEVPGLVPDENWKLQAKGEKWYLGDTYHLAIGQGDLDVTPLQVNQMTNIVASGGYKCTPSVLKDKPNNCVKLGIKKENLEVVKQGMQAACKPGGTAWPLFNFKTKIACKTGTAQIGDGSNDENAWLTAFAPADFPEISITVMVERGGEGSDVAAPIVGDILKEWFDEPNTVVPRHTTATDKTVISE